MSSWLPVRVEVGFRTALLATTLLGIAGLGFESPQTQVGIAAGTLPTENVSMGMHPRHRCVSALSFNIRLADLYLDPSVF